MWKTVCWVIEWLKLILPLFPHCLSAVDTWTPSVPELFVLYDSQTAGDRLHSYDLHPNLPLTFSPSIPPSLPLCLPLCLSKFAPAFCKTHAVGFVVLDNTALIFLNENLVMVRYTWPQQEHPSVCWDTWYYEAVCGTVHWFNMFIFKKKQRNK